MIEYIAWIAIFSGVFFYVSGSIGMLRFPDIYCRLHAVTKADNLGLGMIMLGLSLLGNSFLFAAKALLIWLLVMFCGAVSASLIARYAAKME
jgi:multicomponent Na+:H+ antiporter subunit G